MNELQKRFEDKFNIIWDSTNDTLVSAKDAYNFFHAEITDMLDRLRLEKQEYEPDYPIPNTDTVEGYNSAVDDLNNKIEREK
jgi:hypothetical protein